VKIYHRNFGEFLGSFGIVVHRKQIHQLFHQVVHAPVVLGRNGMQVIDPQREKVG